MTAHDDHGHSPANWAATIIELVATTLIVLGIIVDGWNWMIIAGVVLVIVGFIAWRLLAAAGLGDAKRVGPPIKEQDDVHRY